MEVMATGVAGTLESGDILVEIKASGRPGITVELDSTVKTLYGKQIEQVIRETVSALGVDGVQITASDKGALDCTVRARTATALCRACNMTELTWQ